MFVLQSWLLSNGESYVLRGWRLRYDTMRFKLSDIWGFILHNNRFLEGANKKYYPRLYFLTMIHNRRVKMTTYIVYFGKRATFFATKSFKFSYLLYILAKWFWNFVQPVIVLDIQHIVKLYLIIRFRNTSLSSIT